MYNWTDIQSLPAYFTADFFTQLHDNAGYIGERQTARGIIEEAIPANLDFIPSKAMLLSELETAVNNMELLIAHINNCDPGSTYYTALTWSESTDPAARVQLWITTLNTLFEEEQSNESTDLSSDA